jgi:chitin biosynthesis protein CHS5
MPLREKVSWFSAPMGSCTLKDDWFRMVPIASFYLGAASPAVSATFNRPQSMSQASLARSPSPRQNKMPSNRASMPVSPRSPPRGSGGATSPSAVASPFVNQETSFKTPRFEPTHEAVESSEHEDNEAEEVDVEAPPARSLSRSGEMNPHFRFPSPTPQITSPSSLPEGSRDNSDGAALVTPSTIEVPAPPPVEKEKSSSSVSLEEGEDEVGDTVEISLN